MNENVTGKVNVKGKKVTVNSVMRNIDYMRGKYLRRVGADKNGFWEIIE